MADRLGEWIGEALRYAQSDEGFPNVLLALILLFLVPSLRSLVRFFRERRSLGPATGPAEDLDTEGFDDEEDDEADAEPAEPAEPEVPGRVRRGRGEQLFIPARGGAAAPDVSLATSAGPGCAGLVLIAIGLFAATVMAERVEPKETAGIRFFALFFVLLGGTFLNLGWQAVRETLETRRRLRAGATAPWLADHAWDPDGGAEVGPEDRVRPGSLPMLVAVVALLVPFHTFWLVSGTFARIVLGIFDLFTLVGLFDLARRLLQSARAGRVRLRWRGAPIWVGEHLAATFESRRRLAATGPAKVVLRCVEERESPFQLWAEEREVPVESVPGGGSRFEVAFDVPAAAPGTTLTAASPLYWQAAVAIPLAGPDFRASFLVPVYERSFTAPALPAGLADTGPPPKLELPVKVFVALLGLFAFWLLSAGGRALLDQVRLVARSERVTGIVVDRRLAENPDGTATWYAVVRYQAGGRSREVEADLDTGGRTYGDGDQVGVLYSPERPDEARVATLVDLFFLPVLVCGFGLVLAAGAIAVVHAARVRGRSRRV